MSGEINRSGSFGRAPVSGSLARQLARERDALAGSTEMTYVTNAALSFLTKAAIGETRDVVREIRDAINEDPLGTELYGRIADAYGNGIVNSLRGFTR